MFGIGLPELILIMAIALIVVGPDKLPELAKTLSLQVVELKRAANQLKDSLQEEEKFDATLGDACPQQVVELSAHSPQALPGDQWRTEQQPKTTEVVVQGLQVEKGEMGV
ncbi:MAG: twin-arginine translocase TatA/TatE family subunit [Desulfobulbaceae bacterium]|nr:twin-arginine translocase TatA/TatE family subunit [Desulfobulbaceae bacterium]